MPPPTGSEALLVAPGARLGGYQIIRLHARGGMGEVYQALQLSVHREVAVKILRPEFLKRNPDFAQRFIDEARAAGARSHPNVVGIHDIGRAQHPDYPDGLLFYSMEFVAGETLRQLIRRSGPLP
jgi:serine/threonine-protein kinase